MRVFEHDGGGASKPLPEGGIGVGSPSRPIYIGRAITQLASLLLATFLCFPLARAQQPTPEEPSTESQAPKPPPFPLPDASQPFLPFNNAWPNDRINTRNDPAPGLILPIHDKDSWHGMRTGRGGLAPIEEDYVALDAWKDWAKLDHYPVIEFEGPNAFVPRFYPSKDPASPREREILLFISGQDFPPSGPRITPSIRLERAAFLIQDPLGREPAESRGLCVFMPGLFGTPEPIAESMSTALRKSGWTVLRMLAQPSRFTERVDFTVAPVPPPVPPGEVSPSSATEGAAPNQAAITKALDTTAAQIAKVLTGRAAECAFAAQAACLHTEFSRPYLKSKSRIAVGFSAGSMTLPTVLAREPDRYSAAVLVGSGCHFWLLNSKSNYATMVGALSLTWTDIERTPEREQQLADRYLAHAPLDSFHTAAALQGKPVLMIQGQHDLAVPTALGDVLWERLGKPEKWMRNAGHEFLFINLHKDYAAIMTWLDTKLPDPHATPTK